jgi:hypothetical protein
VTDATILVPTHDHPRLLPYALRSALAQTGVEVEVLVVGDGVTDETREAIEPFLADRRVRFFDNPKGRRHGEEHRHSALAHAGGRVVCYLSDDDLLLADHVEELLRLLDGADFAHSGPFTVGVDGSLEYLPVELAREDYRALLARGRWNAIGLTGAGHTLEAYRRLEHGWRPAPDDVWTDLHMWRQFLALPGFRGRTGTRLTTLHFPSPPRAELSVDERVAELERWWSLVDRPGFRRGLEDDAADAVRRAALWYRAYAHDLEARLQAASESRESLHETITAMEATRAWRARNLLVRIRPVRALLARSPEAR